MGVLITEALSAKAHRLKKRYANDGVIMGDFNELPEVMIRSGTIKKLPHPDSAAYPHQMLSFCLDNSIATVCALNPLEYDALKPVLQLFDEYGIDIQSNNNDL